MEKILVLVLLVVINVQLVVAACSSETTSVCDEGYNVCVTAAGGFNTTCDCYGAYTKCLIDNNCVSSESFQSLVNHCQSDLGCTLQQCYNGDVKKIARRTTVEVPSSTPATPTSSCNSQSATNCANKYQSCVLSAGTNINAICNCYGPYIDCLWDTDCLTPSQYQTIVQACSQSGCTLQQCTADDAPVVPSSSQCNSQSATVCANEYQSCVLSAGTNINAICSCYGPYFECLWAIDCLTYSQYQSLVKSCTQAGCTQKQCTSDSILAPATVPTISNFPSTPIATPSSASIGPTPASAAIVGVIVYLLHGRSSVKKTNKYV